MNFNKLMLFLLPALACLCMAMACVAFLNHEAAPLEWRLFTTTSFFMVGLVAGKLGLRAIQMHRSGTAMFD